MGTSRKKKIRKIERESREGAVAVEGYLVPGGVSTL
jgi:hypothetical protein